ncbi:putative secreted protein [Rhodopirellula sallentina SM41]|uniref:Putative secreted protein n=2 Tax=Rhodopirellula TaxID=265488 RepID=M5U7V6_9BACT|nr:putative secreted protein [Rhodopirellula sallentina SM41]
MSDYIAMLYARANVLVVFGALLLLSFSQASASENKVAWQDEISKHDLTWDRLPNRWMESPFLGNGEQGTMMYQENEKTLRWTVGNSSAFDHRPANKDDFNEKNVEVLNRGRLFIGHLRVEFPATLRASSSRLSLWNAESIGQVQSENGSASWKTIVHANAPVMRFEIETTGDLSGAKFVYVPVEAQNPRALRSKNPRKPANPPAVLDQLTDGTQTAVHNLYAGGQTAVAWKQSVTDNRTTLWLSVLHSFPELDAVNRAVAAVRNAASKDQDAWTQQHRQWWHDYYQQSFLATGDPYWDAFYWIQQYKLASATRADKWIIDNQGPWLHPTAWNAIWWNLNAQLSHSGFATANRRGMGAALGRRLDQCRDQLAENVAQEYRHDSYAIGRTSSGWDLAGHAGQPGDGRPPKDGSIGRETANLLWALHNVDMECRYWQDDDLRDRVLYPLLVRAVNYYRHFLVEESDGYLHLPKTYSPEYRIAEDCTYDLDLLRWGSGRLLELADEMNLNKEEQPLISYWTQLQEKLVPVHVDETGRMIGRGVSLTGPHRHWSHLLAIYPLRTLVPDSADNRELIELSLDNWHSHGKRMAGYSVTGGACISAILGDGERAYEFLNKLKPFLHPNTFYTEAGTLPVIETPLHGATTMQEMLLHQWGGRIRVFPAVPSRWANAQFDRFRCDGAFLVSAQQKDGETHWVEIIAETGGTVDVQPQLIDANWEAAQDASVEPVEPGVYRLKLAKGESVLFWPNDQPKPSPEIRIDDTEQPSYSFGVSAKRE